MSANDALDFLGGGVESKLIADFDEDVLAAACADVRGACDWHVAPVRTVTLTVSGSGRDTLHLPTRALSAVSAVRDVGGYWGATNPITITDWRRPPGKNYLLRSAGSAYADFWTGSGPWLWGWPRGKDNIEVDATHGFAQCPDDLLAVVAERARAIAAAPTPGVQTDQKVTGSRSRYRMFSSDGPKWSLAATAVLDRYRILA